MDERNTPGWRAWAAGSAFVLLLVGGLLIVRNDDEPTSPPAPTTPEAPVAARPAVSQPPPPLGRADLITAVDRAAGRFAAGQPLDVALLAGRRVALSLPFGCGGPVEDLTEAESGWTYDAESKTLRVKVKPEVWTDSPLIAAAAGQAEVEAAEGFWLARPWTAAETCPAEAAPTAALAPTRQTLALVELFEPGSKRAARRSGRAYQAVQTIEPADLDPKQGFRLRIEGRLVGLGDGPPIGCGSESPQLRPVCIVRVRFDRVAITDSSGARMLADWEN